MARHPRVRARLLIGEDRISNNPKLNNLQKGWLSATGDWVVMADSNLLLPQDYLWRLLEATGPEVALVSSPPIAVAPEGFCGALECAFLNTNQARLQLAADAIGHGFAQGKTLFLRRSYLDAQGGLAALGGRLAEDVAATQIVRGSGARVALTRAPFAQPIGRRTLHQVWARQLRWSKVRRDGFPRLFLAEPLNGAVLPLLCAALAAGPLVAAVFAALWYGAELALARRCKWPLGRWALADLPLRDMLAPALWLATFSGRGFEWRGNALAPGSLERLAE